MLLSTASNKEVSLISLVPDYVQESHTLQNAKPKIIIWEFLLNSLNDPRLNPSIIEWVDKRSGAFKPVDTIQLVREWKAVRGRSLKKMDIKDEINYFFRAIRYHYKTGYLESDPEKGVYKFGEKTNWLMVPRKPAFERPELDLIENVNC